MVAGEAALLRSLKTTASNASIDAGVDNIDAANPKYAGQLGTGRINLLKALKLNGQFRITVFKIPPDRRIKAL